MLHVCSACLWVIMYAASRRVSCISLPSHVAFLASLEEPIFSQSMARLQTVSFCEIALCRVECVFRLTSNNILTMWELNIAAVQELGKGYYGNVPV